MLLSLLLRRLARYRSRSRHARYRKKDPQKNQCAGLRSMRSPYCTELLGLTTYSSPLASLLDHTGAHWRWRQTGVQTSLYTSSCNPYAPLESCSPTCNWLSAILSPSSDRRSDLVSVGYRSPAVTLALAATSLPALPVLLTTHYRPQCASLAPRV